MNGKRTRRGKWGVSVILMLMFLPEIALSQQFPIMDQYLVTPSSISPAFVGKDSPLEVFLTSRIEWTGISSHPLIGSLNVSAALPKNMGLVQKPDKLTTLDRLKLTTLLPTQIDHPYFC